MPACFVTSGVGASQHEDHVGGVARRGPDLLAVDDPLVAVELGLAAEVGQVAAGVGLGVALTPHVGAVEDAGDVVRLLLVGAPVQDRVADHADAEAVVPARRRHASLGELFVEHDVFEMGQSAAAVFGRPVRGEQLVVSQGLAPLGLEVACSSSESAPMPFQSAGRFLSRNP